MCSIFPRNASLCPLPFSILVTFYISLCFPLETSQARHPKQNFCFFFYLLFGCRVGLTLGHCRGAASLTWYLSVPLELIWPEGDPEPCYEFGFQSLAVRWGLNLARSGVWTWKPRYPGVELNQFAWISLNFKWNSEMIPYSLLKSVETK